MPEHVFPQDSGTGATDSSDWDDAASFAWHEDSINERDYIVGGLEFTVNAETATLNISEGKAKIYQEQAETNDHTGDGGEAAKVLMHTLFTVQTEPSGDIALSDGSVNHVYLGLNQQENDGYVWQVNTDQTPPPDPYLKLGTIDLSGDGVVAEQPHRAPAGRFRELIIE